MKHLIIIWSGGFDSTAVLLESAADASKFDKVSVISCELENANPECSKLDKEAREKIRAELSSKAPFQSYAWHTSKIDLNGTGNGTGQAIVWAHLAAMAVSTNEETEIRFGYIRGDDFWHNRSWFETALFNLTYIDSKLNTTIRYPFEWNVKKEMLTSYVKYPQIFPLISWGGDTHEIKLKEKEDLLSTFNLMMDARKVEIPAAKSEEILQELYHTDKPVEKVDVSFTIGGDI